MRELIQSRVDAILESQSQQAKNIELAAQHAKARAELQRQHVEGVNSRIGVAAAAIRGYAAETAQYLSEEGFMAPTHPIVVEYTEHGSYTTIFKNRKSLVLHKHAKTSVDFWDVSTLVASITTTTYGAPFDTDRVNTSTSVVAKSNVVLTSDGKLIDPNFVGRRLSRFGRVGIDADVDPDLVKIDRSVDPPGVLLYPPQTTDDILIPDTFTENPDLVVDAYKNRFSNMAAMITLGTEHIGLMKVWYATGKFEQ